MSKWYIWYFLLVGIVFTSHATKDISLEISLNTLYEDLIVEIISCCTRSEQKSMYVGLSGVNKKFKQFFIKKFKDMVYPLFKHILPKYYVSRPLIYAVYKNYWFLAEQLLKNRLASSEKINELYVYVAQHNKTSLMLLIEKTFQFITDHKAKRAALCNAVKQNQTKVVKYL